MTRFASSRRRSARRSSTPDPLRRGARFSRDRRYRYALVRSWDPGAPRCTFVLLNPSTADEERDDPTLRRCVGFARAAGFGSTVLVNLFALRATDPAALARARDPVGPRNDRAIVAAARGANAVVLGWGAGAASFAPRTAEVWWLLAPFRRRLFLFGRTRSGEPRHPLYLRATTALRPAVPAAGSSRRRGRG